MKRLLVAKRKTSVSRTLLLGGAAGMAGGWTMAEFSRLWNKLDDRTVNDRPYSREEWDASSTIAEFVAARVFRRELRKSETASGVALVHYATAAASGALFASIFSRYVRNSRWSGALFGSALWLAGNLIPHVGHEGYSQRDQVQAISEHLVYGLTVAFLCRLVA
jgi:hypothetical protein